MDPGKVKPKILFLRRPISPDNPTGENPWSRFIKALTTFAEVQEKELIGEFPDNSSDLIQGFEHVFLDISLVNWKSLSKGTVANLTLVSPEAFTIENNESQVEKSAVLSQQSCLVLDSLSASDLVRTLHLYLLPKRLAGVTAIMEKGSVVLAEKLMALDNLGKLIDSASTYFNQIDGLELKERIPDLRQVVSGLIFSAFQCAVDSGSLYPFVDFQVSASSKKLAVNLRFPIGKLNPENLQREILANNDLHWHQSWLCSDLMLISNHVAHKEIEVMILICRKERFSPKAFRTLFVKRLKTSAKKEVYLDPPQNFVFKLVSEIRPKDTEVLFVSNGNMEEISNDIDFGGLPENVTKKIHALSEKAQQYEDQARQKEAKVQDLSSKIQNLNREISAKRSEVIRAMKAAEVQSENSNRKINELESKIEYLKKTIEEKQQINKDQAASPNLQESVLKLESSLRAIENEKSQLKENLANEQKKVGIFEQKYSALYKEISLKDKEINDLKSAFTKLKKEQPSPESSKANSSVADQSSKIREVESREAALKQELRKLAFKLESQDKNIKAIQGEATDKAKLMEQKLQEAKTREVELLKKIEELSANLKKAAKVA